MHLDDLVLSDCPGLVFPNFGTTKAEMVVNGVLPIDQMREHVGPVAVLAQRIPKNFLENFYGIRIPSTGETPTAEELMVALAVARGYTKSGQGNPDESKAARHILRDYVNGRLPYNHSPPGMPDMNGFVMRLDRPMVGEARQVKEKVTDVDFTPPPSAVHIRKFGEPRKKKNFRK